MHMEVTEKLSQMLQGEGAYGQHNVQGQRLSCSWNRWKAPRAVVVVEALALQQEGSSA